MGTREHDREDEAEIVRLMAQLRCTLDGLKGSRAEVDLAAARGELRDCLRHGHTILVHEVGRGRLAGFIVCRDVDGVTWAESLFVDPEWRRKGIGTDLFTKAQELAFSRGQDTLYTWIHPNNDGTIQFLRAHGYDVLNLIEVRRAHKGETTPDKIRVMDNEFRY